MTNASGRLGRLETAIRRTAPAPPGGDDVYDFSHLSMREQFELDQLLAHEWPLPGESWAARELTGGERARLAELLARVEGAPR